MIIIVADDERYMREEIAEILHNLEQSHQLTLYFFRDGAQALEQALLTPPHLLLTDIRMPRLNGLELASQVRALAPECQIIFLSNYSEERYLRQAIKLRAVEYIDKPELKKLLPGLVKEILAQYQQTAPSRLDKDDINAERITEAKELLFLLWSQMLRNKTASLESLRPQCIRYGANYFYQSAYRCIFLQYHQGDPQDKKRLYDCLTNYLEKEQIHLLSCDSPEHSVQIYFLYSESPASLDESLLHRLWSVLIDSRTQHPTITGLCAGCLAPSYREAFSSYQSAQASYNRLYFSDTPRLILLEKIPSGSAYDLQEEELWAWLEAASNLYTARAKKLLQGIFNTLASYPDTPIASIRDYFCRGAERMLQISTDNLLDFHKKHTASDLRQSIWQALNLPQLRNLLSDWLDELMTCGLGEDRTVRMVIAYIRRHYMERDLNLDDLSRFTNYSKSYLCRVFHKQMGTTINTYLNNIRMNQACILLETTHKNLEEISSLVGFSNSKYFGKSFKSYVRVTPTEYRRIRMLEEENLPD